MWERRRPRFLLSGLVECGACGGGYVQISRTLLGCASARNKGTCSNRLNMRRDRLEATILDGLRSRIMDPALFSRFVTDFHTEVNRLRGNRDVEQEAARSEIERIDRQLERLVDAVLAGGDARRSSMPGCAPWKRGRRRCNRSWKPPSRHARGSIPTSLLFTGSGSRPCRPPSPTRPRASARWRRSGTLVDRVVLVPEGGELRIDLHGRILKMLELCANSKTPGCDVRALAEQIELVAGARNHRELTLPAIAI